ncbi:MAG: nuclear transport factor 2 family protein [Stappiaceae bacterium]
MRMIAIILALLLINLPASADTENDAIRADLIAFNDTFNDYARTYDIEGIVSLYDEKALWIAADAEPVAGQETPRKVFTMLTEHDGSLHHTVDKLIIAQDGSQAVMIGGVQASLGKAGPAFDGTYLFVLERRGEEWKIVADMFHQYKAK